MKIAPLMRAFAQSSTLCASLVHTGQHYDQAMKSAFFDQLQIPEPDVDLGVGSGSHAVQTAEIMKRFEPVLDASCPDAVLVVGDVNSTIACALVAAKKSIPVVHVEAGLRSFDRTMPEEINRILTDQLSALLYTTEPAALRNLISEGVDPGRVRLVGNVMIDTLLANRARAPQPDLVFKRAGIGESRRHPRVSVWSPCIAHPMSMSQER
jgi:UDP-N-acetylglucosamine 2-epimerase (non-hydrolysing)